MDKWKLLVKRGLKNRIFRKAFIISNIIIFVALMLLINLPIILAGFIDSEPVTINYSVAVFSEVNKVSSSDNTEFNIINYLQDHPNFIALEMNITFELVEQIDDFMNNSSLFNAYIELLSSDGYLISDNTVINIFISPHNQSLANPLFITLDRMRLEVLEINNIVNINLPPLEDEIDLASLISIIVTLPLFFIIIFGSQLLGVEIVDEKSSKAIEIIIASVPAKTHFLAKTSAVFLFMAIQTIIFILFSFIANGISMLFTNPGGNYDGTFDFISSLLGGINLTQILLFMILITFVASVFYLVIAAFFASLATTQEDYQTIQTPFVMVLLLGFYAAIFLPMLGDSFYSIIRVLSFIPFFSPFIVLTAFALGAITLGEMFLSILILILTTVGLIFLIAPLYKVTILDYDGGKMMTRIKKAYRLSRKNQ